MKQIIINNIIFFTFGIMYYFIGIITKYFNFNIFESYLFTTLLVIYGFLSSNVFIIYDKLHPIHTINKLYNLSKKDKILLFLSCCPFYKLIVLSYINLDPIIIQLINSMRICINPIIYSLYYREYYLCNYIIIINIIINVSACIIPLIINDNFISSRMDMVQLNSFSILSILNTIICMILTAICNIYNEKINIKYDLINDFGINTFIIYTFMLIDVIFSILLAPIIILIYYIINGNLNNLILLNNFYIINTITSISGILYGPYIIYMNNCYLHITSLNVCVMNNLVLIISIILSCLMKFSIFYYIYIPAIFIIIITSFIITYKIELFKK